MQAADIMTREVVTVTAETPIEELVQLMLRHRISGVPVTDGGGTLCGIVSEGDLLRRAETGTEQRRPRWLQFLLSPGRLAEDYVRSHARKAGDVMTEEVFSVAPESPLEDVVELMERRHIRRVPVIKAGKMVGIVSRADLLHALADLLHKGARPGEMLPDREILRRVLAEIDQQAWAPRCSIEVVVHDGVVELSGAVTDEREREALRVAAETVSEVKAVRDHLVWVEPVSGMLIDAPGNARRDRATGGESSAAER